MTAEHYISDVPLSYRPVPFDGFPYFISRVVPAMHHYILLPTTWEVPALLVTADRTPEVRAKAADAIFEQLKAVTAAVYAKRPLGLSFEIVEIDRSELKKSTALASREDWRSRVELNSALVLAHTGSRSTGNLCHPCSI